MKTLKELPNVSKPISREAIARCIEVETRDRDLAERVRADTSFDVAIVSFAIAEDMKVELFRFDREVPLFDSYCGDAIGKAMAQLSYDIGYGYSSAVIIR